MAIAIWLAQLLRRYLLLWVWSLVWRGWRRPLEAHDLPALPPGLTQSDARLAAELWWSDGEKANRRSIVGLTWRFHRREFLAGIAMSSCYGLCNVVLRPLLLKLTIEQERSGDEIRERRREGAITRARERARESARESEERERREEE